MGWCLAKLATRLQLHLKMLDPWILHLLGWPNVMFRLHPCQREIDVFVHSTCARWYVVFVVKLTNALTDGPGRALPLPPPLDVLPTLHTWENKSREEKYRDRELLCHFRQ